MSTNWDPLNASSSPPPSNAAEAMRERYLERSLEKLLRYQKQPRNRPVDLVVLALLVLCLGVLLFRPPHGGDAAAIQALSARIDKLTVQQQALELALRQAPSTHRAVAVAPMRPGLESHPTALPVTPVRSLPPSDAAPAAVGVARPGPAAVEAEVPDMATQPTTVAMATPAASEQVHKLQTGESLWAVCQKYYGDPDVLAALAQYNGIANASATHAGMEIKIPPIEKLRALRPVTPAPVPLGGGGGKEPVTPR